MMQDPVERFTHHLAQAGRPVSEWVGQAVVDLLVWARQTERDAITLNRALDSIADEIRSSAPATGPGPSDPSPEKEPRP